MSKPASGSLAHVVNTLWKQYNVSASSKVKVCDAIQLIGTTGDGELCDTC